jgi:hypothetical protein
MTKKEFNERYNGESIPTLEREKPDLFAFLQEKCDCGHIRDNHAAIGDYGGVTYWQSPFLDDDAEVGNGKCNQECECIEFKSFYALVSEMRKVKP